MAEAECGRKASKCLSNEILVSGDDVWGLDPTVNAFQKEAAEKFGFKTALYLPTATMSNLVAMLVHCEKKGSEIILGDKAHMHMYSATISDDSDGDSLY